MPHRLRLGRKLLPRTTNIYAFRIKEAGCTIVHSSNITLHGTATTPNSSHGIEVGWVEGFRG